MVQLSGTMEQTRETQLAQLYDVLGFRRVIARYDVLSTLHETGPWTVLLKIKETTCFKDCCCVKVRDVHQTCYGCLATRLVVEERKERDMIDEVEMANVHENIIVSYFAVG